MRLPLLSALLQRLATDVAAVGAHLLVVLAQPASTDGKVSRAECTADVLQVLAEHGIAAVDTFPAFAACKAPADLCLPNLHWSRTGHERAAGLILAELQRRSSVVR